MTVKVSSIGLKGLEGYRVQVEVQISSGMTSMVIVGLPDASVKESKERVLSAIRTIGCATVPQRIVVNLSPSEQKKNGPMFDLAMAIGILKESEFLKADIPLDTIFIGALSLDGEVEKVEGMLPAIVAASELGFRRVFLPYDSLLPLDMIEEMECIVVQHLNDVIRHLCGLPVLPLPKNQLDFEQQPETNEYLRDFSQIIGHHFSKKALEIAAAGGHNVLMTGPPGCGKSLLAETFPSIIPPLTKHQQLQVISLYQLAREKLIAPNQPPFRQPHHSASSIAIIGGGSYPKPGEISLAHHGVLFLDEMAEFNKKTLDMLRQPMESGKVIISRVHSTVTYPSSFILIGAMNPCPCGYLGSRSHYCTCTRKQVHAYRNRLSGPIFDRMDILLNLDTIDLDQNYTDNETSAEIQSRVIQAQRRQFARYKNQTYNSRVPFEQLSSLSPLSETQRKLIRKISTEQHWSNRVQIKIIRLARTISDLADSPHITDKSIIEAIQLRDGTRGQVP